MIKYDNELNELDQAELGRLIAEGNTSGILDSEEYRIAWSLEYNKFHFAEQDEADESEKELAEQDLKIEI